MVLLLIVTLSIAALATSYAAIIAPAKLPAAPWQLDFDQTTKLETKGFCRLERTTLDEIAARNNVLMPALNQGGLLNGVPYARPDGGLEGYMAYRYRFLPQPIEGATWKYGLATVSGVSTAYICLDASATGLSKGSYRALQAYQRSLPAGRFVISNACGSTAPASTPSTFPVGAAVTLFISPGAPITPPCSTATSASTGTPGDTTGGSSGDPTGGTPPSNCQGNANGNGECHGNANGHNK